MPAADPAEVSRSPSSTHSTSGTTSTFGYRARKASRYIQWVVARRPSSRPASASTNAPEQNETIRAPLAAAARRASRTSSSGSPGIRQPHAICSASSVLTMAMG